MNNSSSTIPEYDSAFPGENWFFYWKTSQGLWRKKLSEFTHSRILVPINWGLHTDSNNGFYFSGEKGETNLLNLVQIAIELKKKLIFILPITPAPFLVNGGVPHHLASQISLDEQFLANAVLDSENLLLKMYSFFDPRVFEAFGKFVFALENFFRANKLNPQIWLAQCGFFKNGQFNSYIEDHSIVFEEAFLKFLKNKKIEEVSENEKFNLSKSFEYSIEELYFLTAKDTLKNFYEGKLEINFLGAGFGQFISRATESLSTSSLANSILESLIQDKFPCSVLLPLENKKGPIKKMLKDLVIETFEEQKFNPQSVYDKEDNGYYSPLVFAKIFIPNQMKQLIFNQWENLNLWNFLRQEYGHNYRIICEEKLKLNEFKGIREEVIYFFSGESITKEVFSFILKTFMSGGILILTTSKLEKNFVRKIETFILENKLSVEKIKFFTEIQCINLGEGKLVLIEEEHFENIKKSDYLHFWENLSEIFLLSNLSIKNRDGIEFYWKTRACQSFEIKFEEIRRLTLFNPTSYKKKLSLNLQKKFAVYKVIDEIHATVRTFPNEVEIELSPLGSVMIDFGVFG